VPDPRGRKPGSMLVRAYGGTLHHVTTLQDGFAWQGSTYRSLSEIARLITGTRWNGPRFFGLREQAGQQDPHRALATEPRIVHWGSSSTACWFLTRRGILPGRVELVW
jgi:hypothetical protein